jgi:hypothetical protein
VNVPARLGAFALGLGVVFAAAVGVGNAVGPVGTPGDAAPSGGHSEEASAGHSDGRHGGTPQPAADDPSVTGLSVSQDGYTLALEQAVLPAATPTELAFTVSEPDGAPLTAYTETHEKDLHLIVVRRDGTGYQHLHPERGASGRWSVPVVLPEAGSYKVFADFAPRGHDPLVVAADLAVPGDFAPEPLPAASTTADVDGYTVTLDGHLDPGEASAVTFTVRRDGQPVTDLQPYLGAYGHLVALRAGDLAYLHVHPDDEPGDTSPGPDVRFSADVPTAGAYRLYLDFQHDGVVRTAEFVVEAQEHA